MSTEEGALECSKLAIDLSNDGWNKSYLEPLLKAKSVLRVGIKARKPFPKWHKGRIVLLGDASHPPVPYIGQGAMVLIELKI